MTIMEQARQRAASKPSSRFGKFVHNVNVISKHYAKETVIVTVLTPYVSYAEPTVNKVVSYIDDLAASIEKKAREKAEEIQ